MATDVISSLHIYANRSVTVMWGKHSSLLS